MDHAQAIMAMEKDQRVELVFFPCRIYVGTLVEEISEGRFLFKGTSEWGEISYRPWPWEISPVILENGNAEKQ
mgnify:CR=1 FL=1